MMTFESYTLTADWNSEYTVGSPQPTPHLIPVSVGDWQPTCDLRSGVPCHENIDLCIFALNLPDVG